MADCLNNEEQVVSGLSGENEDNLKSEINNGDLLSSNVDNGDIVTSNAVLDEAISSTIQEDGAINSTLDLPITTSGSTVNVIDNLVSTDTKSALSANQGRVLNELINGVKADLKNYYTQSEVNSLITAIPKFAIKVVNSLPTENISPATVYLLASGSENQNLYTEYIYINGVWEKLGEQKVDLSDYPTISQVNDLLDGKVDKVDGKGLSTNDLTNELLQEIQDGLTKELTSPVYIHTTKAGIYRIPKDCQINYYEVVTIPSEAYLFIVDTAENRKEFYVLYSENQQGIYADNYIGFGNVTFSTENGFALIGGYSTFNFGTKSDYVDTSTDQTIGGLKTFSQAPKLYGSLSEKLDDKSLVSAEWVNDKLDKKQNILTAGNNISITDGIISAELSGSAPIILLESPIRIWDLDSGIYKVPANATIYYNGATSTSSIPYYNAGSSILIVNNLVSTTAVPIPYPYKKYILFATITEGLQKSGFITGKVLADTGSYWFFDTETSYLPLAGGTIDGDLSVKGQIKFPNDVPTDNSSSWIYVCKGNSAKSGFGATSLTSLGSRINASKDGDGNVIKDTYTKLDGSNYHAKLTEPSENGNVTGWRHIASFTMGKWAYAHIELSIKSRHSGVGLLTIGICDTNGGIDTVDGSIRFYGSTDSTMYTNAWKMIYNTTTGATKVYWKFSDYNTCEIKVLGLNGFTCHWNSGDWLTTEPVAGTNEIQYLPIIYNKEYLPLTGGTLTGNLSIKKGSDWSQFQAYSKSGYYRAFEANDDRARIDVRNTTGTSDRRYIDIYSGNAKTNNDESIMIVRNSSTDGTTSTYVATQNWVNNKIANFATQNWVNTSDTMQTNTTRTNQHDTVKEFWMNSDGTEWHRIWRSGFKEWGMLKSNSSNTDDISITFTNFSFSSSNYIIQANMRGNKGSGGTADTTLVCRASGLVHTQTTTGFTFQALARNYMLYACGI